MKSFLFLYGYLIISSFFKKDFLVYMIWKIKKDYDVCNVLLEFVTLRFKIMVTRCLSWTISTLYQILLFKKAVIDELAECTIITWHLSKKILIFINGTSYLNWKELLRIPIKSETNVTHFEKIYLSSLGAKKCESIVIHFYLTSP